MTADDMTADDISIDDWDDDGGAVPEPDRTDAPDDRTDSRGTVDADHRRTHRRIALLGVAALVVAVAALLMPRGR